MSTGCDRACPAPGVITALAVAIPRKKFVKGFQTGDIVKAVVTSGKKIGTYVGRVAVRSTGSFNISTANGLIQGISHKCCTRVHAKDGYAYNA